MDGDTALVVTVLTLFAAISTGASFTLVREAVTVGLDYFILHVISHCDIRSRLFEIVCQCCFLQRFYSLRTFCKGSFFSEITHVPVLSFFTYFLYICFYLLFLCSEMMIFIFTIPIPKNAKKAQNIITVIC